MGLFTALDAVVARLAQHLNETEKQEAVDNRLTEVIQRAQSGGFSLQNDYARTNAQVVAMAASCGYITTEQKRGSFGRKWLATRKGKAYLEVNA
jgi:hypothetical protein